MGAKQVALVTGAGRGIGRAIAYGLAEDGLRVAIVDIDLPAAEETATCSPNTFLKDAKSRCVAV